MKHPLTRRTMLRNFLGTAVLCAVAKDKLFAALAQGVASGGLGPGVEPRSGPPLAQYVDLAARAGLTARTIIGGEKTKEFILETTGGGIALFDYDIDGWLAIFLVNGSRLEGFPRGTEPTNRLYKNNRDGTFTDVTVKAGLVKHGWGQGVCAGDYDNDGFLDLFVTYYGQNVLYHNNGDGTFTDVTRASGLLDPGVQWSAGAAWLDFDRDGRLDLFVSHYVGYEDALKLYESSASLEGEQSPVLYGVAGLKGTHNTLYRNSGDSAFTDVSKAAGILSPQPAYSFTPLVADFDNDGWPDIY